MDEMYHEGNRELQERFDTRRLAHRFENLLVHETFTGRDKAFVESRDMFLLATADDHGRPNVSYKAFASRAALPSSSVAEEGTSTDSSRRRAVSASNGPSPGAARQTQSG
jgi:hypothetical protein